MTTPTRSRPSAGQRIRALVSLRRAVLSVVLAAGLGAVVIGFLESADPQPPQKRPPTIIRVFPTEGAQARLQEPVGYQIADDYTGELRIDGVDIPLDQLQRRQSGDAVVAAGLVGLNQVSFTPGEGKQITKLKPGSHRVTARYWLTATQTREDAAFYDWTFTAT